MPLVVQDVTLDDFETMKQYQYGQGGDLIAPVLPFTWPVDDSDSEAAAARNEWSLKQQREIFLDDASARFKKVVDTDSNDIISLARWHYYEHGYQHPEFDQWEFNGKAPGASSTWPKGIDSSLHVAFLQPLFEARAGWQGTKPAWVLTTLKTRQSQQRRGAGSMLIDWGVKQAQKDGVPAFLEAAPEARPLYEKFGFKYVGELVVNGLTLSRMAANAD